MSVADIRDLDINPRIINIVLRANLDTFEKILSLSVPELILLTKLSKRDVSMLISAVSEACLSSSIVSAWKLYLGDSPEFYRHYKISTGCNSIDELLLGGILTRAITEISGESSTGKTQLCLQLSLHVQLPMELGGLNCGVAYVCTEQSFPIKRLNQLAHVYQKKYTSFENFNFLNNIFIDQVGDLASLWHCLKQDLPALLRCKNIKLIIIDSVAALFRCEYNIQGGFKRRRDLHSLGSLLRKLINDYGAAVVCVNQVTSVISSSNQYRELQDLKPSLGLYWSSLLTNRLMLSRTRENADSVYFISVRSMELLFSPYLPLKKCHFAITSKGVEEC